jgi:hypothetical protein
MGVDRRLTLNGAKAGNPPVSGDILLDLGSPKLGVRGGQRDARATFMAVPEATMHQDGNDGSSPEGLK